MDDVSFSIGKLTEGWCHGLNANQGQSFILVPQSLTGLVHKHNGWCHLFHLALAQLCHGHCQREWWAVLIATLLEMMLSDRRENGGRRKRRDREKQNESYFSWGSSCLQAVFFDPFQLVLNQRLLPLLAQEAKALCLSIIRGRAEKYLHCESQTGTVCF